MLTRREASGKTIAEIARTSGDMITCSGMFHAYRCWTLCHSEFTGPYRIEYSCSIDL